MGTVNMQLKAGTNGIMFGDLLLARLSAHFVFGYLSSSSYLFQGIWRKLTNFIFHGAYSKGLLVADVSAAANSHRKNHQAPKHSC